MNIEESFYNAWLDTRTKALNMFSGSSYFPEDTDLNQYYSSLAFIHTELEYIFDSATRPIGHVDETTVVNFFQHLREGISCITEELLIHNEEENWIDFLIAVLNNLPPYLLDNFSSKLNESPTKKHIEKLYPIGESVLTWFYNKAKSNTESEETFRQLTEVSIDKMLKEFNLSSVQLMDDITWNKQFKNVQQVYNSIRQSHAKIGLPSNNLGANQMLNLVISEDFLNDRKWMGFQSKTNSSFSIFINPTPTNTAETWIHEYTHFLDRLGAHIFSKENNIEEEISTFSHLALKYVVNQTPIKNTALQIMAETMSATIGGVGAEEFSEKMRKAITTTKEHIALKIILETLPNGDKTWEDLSFGERQTLLFKSKISELTEFIMLQVSNHPKGTFSLSNQDIVISIEGDNITSSKLFVPDIIGDIHERIKALDPFVMHSNLNEYLKENLAKDVKFIMNQHNLVIYKDHSIYDDRFFLSPGNDVMRNAQNMQKEDSEVIFSYYDKPLELLARMVENLQSPLLNNLQFKNLTKNTKDGVFNPILGKEERLMVCATLHSLARYVGIEVENMDINHLPCVMPEDLADMEGIVLSETDPSDYFYAQPNQIIPDDARRKVILQNIERIKSEELGMDNNFAKRKSN